MKDILYRLFEHQYLGREEARLILQRMAAGEYNDSQIASLITVFLMRNISVEELSGFREALLEMRVPVDLTDYTPIDIVGTGGDGKNTFNISTASSFVVAGAGYNVVKHGNYGSTSLSVPYTVSSSKVTIQDKFIDQFPISAGMKLTVMASELERQLNDQDTYGNLGFEERIGLLVDAEWNKRQSNK